MDFIKRNLDYVWPALGFVAVLASFWLLFREFQRPVAWPAAFRGLQAIPPHRYFPGFRATVVAYVALAYYDWIALLHLGVRHIAWRFITACSFTTYALSHNIGASVVSGAMVRYRGYATKGLSAAQVAVLVAICSITFVLGELLVGGSALLARPHALSQLDDFLPAVFTHASTGRILGLGSLGAVAAYVGGGLFKLPTLSFFGAQISYPSWESSRGS